MTEIRVILPGHLKRLAQVDHELEVKVEDATIAAVLDAIETSYPVLRGTIRDQQTGKRRNFIRFFACNEDLSHEPVDAPLPQRVQTGDEPLLVVGAMAGG